MYSIRKSDNVRVFGNKEYHYYKTMPTRDSAELKQMWLRKRGYEFKMFSDNGHFDIFTYPKVMNGR